MLYKRQKCAFKNCKVRLELYQTFITCKCKKNFCSVHRIEHECNECIIQSQLDLEKQLQPCIAPKLDII